MENKPNRIIWHHSAVLNGTPQALAINTYHKSKGFPISTLGFYGGYHILIEKDGTIFRYRNDNEIGAHDAGENINSLGICMTGNFDIEVPTVEQQATFLAQIKSWIGSYNIPIENIEPHRKNDTTHCPGLKMPDDYPQKLLNLNPPKPENENMQKIIDFIKTLM